MWRCILLNSAHSRTDLSLVRLCSLDFAKEACVVSLPIRQGRVVFQPIEAFAQPEDVVIGINLFTLQSSPIT
jgi:hypothetical protein